MFIKKISFTDKTTDAKTVVVGVYSDGTLSKCANDIDAQINGVIKKIIEKSAFSGKRFETSAFVSDQDSYNYIVLIGLGAPGENFSKFDLEKLGAKAYHASKTLDQNIVIAIDKTDLTTDSNSPCLEIAFGALLKSWDFDTYKPKKNEKVKLTEVAVLSDDVDASTAAFVEYKNIADGIFLTRNVVSEPANVIYPESFAEIAKREMLPLGVEIEILDEGQMKALGMNALLGVAQGSAHKPHIAILKWNGASDKTSKPIAFVGKGVTFDSGGISLKPGDGMHEMRYDMAGAGSVLGLIKAVALNKMPINVYGVMALVENMPSGFAQRPGDIVKSMSGQTIEVLNTDAEGRLILADAIWYTQQQFAPSVIVDLATLTGAIVVALGHEFAGLFSNSDDLADKIYKSSIETGEKVWRLPMTDHFDNGINSDIADMQNIGKSNVRAGSITAAHFLKRFTNGVDWAHIDIAGVDISSDDLFIASKGATGFGVHLLYNFLKANYNADTSVADKDADGSDSE